MTKLTRADWRNVFLKYALYCREAEGAPRRLAFTQLPPAELDLSRLNLSGIVIPGAHFFKANFTNTSLVRANLVGCVLSQANFTNCNLSYAVLDNATCWGALFCRTTCVGTRWPALYPHPEHGSEAITLQEILG